MSMAAVLDCAKRLFGKPRQQMAARSVNPSMVTQQIPRAAIKAAIAAANAARAAELAPKAAALLALADKAGK